MSIDLAKLTRLSAELSIARRQVVDEGDALASVEKHLADCQEAQAFLQTAARVVQETAHQQIAAVVTKCLRAVFGEDAYEFRIHFEQKRGKTEARFAFVRGGEEFGPLDSSGGGVVDVASFALRLAALLLSRPAVRRLLVLDEPFKHLSKEYRPQVRDLILSLAEDLGVQFVIVTHDPVFQVGKVVEL